MTSFKWVYFCELSLIFCEDLFLRISSKFEKLANINPDSNKLLYKELTLSLRRDEIQFFLFREVILATHNGLFILVV